MNLVIDIGNTAVKMAIFDDGRMVEASHAPMCEVASALTKMDAANRCQRGIVCSVAGECVAIDKFCDECGFPVMRFGADTPMPVVNEYRSPQTLGLDRIAAVVGARAAMGQKNALVVDAGSCVTYDFVTADGRYKGGNIAPGMAMRFRAMHEHTARLPLVTTDGDVPQLGYDTLTAMRSGVVMGMVNEIRGYVHYLYNIYGECHVMLTGGDSALLKKYFNDTADHDAYLVLRGLDYILRYNENNV